MKRIGRGDFGLRPEVILSVLAVGRRTSSSILPFLGVYPNSSKFGCKTSYRKLWARVEEKQIIQ